jgi:hypothetical protein
MMFRNTQSNITPDDIPDHIVKYNTNSLMKFRNTQSNITPNRLLMMFRNTQSNMTPNQLLMMFRNTQSNTNTVFITDDVPDHTVKYHTNSGY